MKVIYKRQIYTNMPWVLSSISELAALSEIYNENCNRIIVFHYDKTDKEIRRIKEKGKKLK